MFRTQFQQHLQRRHEGDGGRLQIVVESPAERHGITGSHCQ